MMKDKGRNEGKRTAPRGEKTGEWGEKDSLKKRGKKAEVIYSDADWRRSRWPLHGSSPIGTSVAVRYRDPFDLLRCEGTRATLTG
jgi:hypothetical protein